MQYALSATNKFIPVMKNDKLNLWRAVYIERCTYGFGARLWKPVLETRQGAVVLAYNIQREELLPSEKAFAYKMKLGAMKRQAGRPPKNNSCQSGTNLRSDEELGNQVGESARSIQRYIRLTELIPGLLDYVDKKRLQFTVAVDISYIDKEIQTWLFEYIKENGTVKAVQVAALRTALEAGPMTQAKMISILVNSQPGRKQEQKITLSEKKLRNFFSDKYTTEDMESVILELLDQWKRGEITV